MKSIRYDTVLKDMFERDRPSLLHELTGGVPIRAFLNVETPKMIDRRVDTVAQLDNGTLCHIEFQSQNHRRMPYRQGIYGLLLADKFQTKVEQTVVYTGAAPLRMRNSIDAGCVKVQYRLIDIRSFGAKQLAASPNAADRALAILGAGSSEHLKTVISAAAALAFPQRERTLTQLALLAGLRGLSKRVTMEMTSMSVAADIHNNAFLAQIHEQAKIEGKVEGKVEGRVEGKAEGRVEGKAEGLAEGFVQGQVKLFQVFLNSKFGPIPTWAMQRIKKATPAQIERWTQKLPSATTLESLLGPRR